ncbi:hypothetical protein MGYG_06740 [Nannizzia gypsea CBS 118893]|uniref:Uncharacterized protein n=1 Tax=Arthroderma gypseum (strain ATCC MYA-4604 / CBS 118893) TaxID=535722 RepID=E4V126_ARTGP|nr:hypothetical protein MGYG_06740 [Nannizzia gypsea CBS 118893]EFR03741.1 hypothetical protein MGYG_06740 [Nannizzia gypsea CBS 118893]
MEQVIYKNTWNSSSYTSFLMLGSILRKLEISFEDFISGRSTISKTSLREALCDVPCEELIPLWESGSGLCTSFSLCVAARIESQNYPSTFTVAELRGHRASFNQRGVVIDSSARQALTLQKQPVKAYKGTWKMERPEESAPVLLFKPSKSNTFSPFCPLKDRCEGMKACLLQLASQSTFICMFRMEEYNQLGFNGRITYKSQERKITWSQVRFNPSTKRQQFFESVVDFSVPGDKETMISYAAEFRGFCEDRARIQQYEIVKPFLAKLWDTCIEELGYGNCYGVWL